MKEISKKGSDNMMKFYIKDGAVYGTKDLNRKFDNPPSIWINPPPPDKRCMCCGKHISKLKPYGKAGDPLVGDFDGALLLKTFRSEGPYDEEAKNAIYEAEENCADKDQDPKEWLTDKYGKEKAEDLFISGLLCNTISSSYECRDCIILGDDEYFEVLYRRLSQEERYD